MSVKDAVKKTVGAVAAACARDSELRSRVEADAKKALADEGLDLPFEEVKLVADTPETKHVALTPPGAELSDEQMEAVVGGWGDWYSWSPENRMGDHMPSPQASSD